MYLEHRRKNEDLNSSLDLGMLLYVDNLENDTKKQLLKTS